TQKVTTANITLNLGFPGQYYDAERQTWNNGYRDYSSGLGRYLESDPSGLNGGINTYTYVEASPIQSTDPMGLDIYVANTAQVGGLHEKIVVGQPGGPLYGQSFGMASRDKPEQSTSSQANPTPGGAGSGEVYEDEDPITAINYSFYLKTNPVEDAAAIAYLKKQLGNSGPYNIMTNSCRNYSQAQYFKLFNLVLGMRY
ncbi:RHS repeat-associated protein, partial [Rhodanobacter sp. K2T2]|uniref:RHS repeat-associated core domain-containing protein n=1 Tax=Rhodanobacter sp. K2T2 TaxID=2723085 RepID=UPI0015CD645C